MPDDRDRRREADPLHDTVDESTGVVRDAVDPDDTPIDKPIALIRDDVGLLSARDERLIRAVEAHRARVDDRRDKRQAPEVDRAQLASLLEHDMTGWPPFKDQAARLAKLEEAEAGRAALIGRLKKWVATGWVAAVLALGGGLVDYGTRRGRSASAEEQAARDRAALTEAIAKNHAQDIEIGVLRALVRTLERNNRRTNGDD